MIGSWRNAPLRGTCATLLAALMIITTGSATSAGAMNLVRLHPRDVHVALALCDRPRPPRMAFWLRGYFVPHVLEGPGPRREGGVGAVYDRVVPKRFEFPTYRDVFVEHLIAHWVGHPSNWIPAFHWVLLDGVLDNGCQFRVSRWLLVRRHVRPGHRRHREETSQQPMPP